MAVCAHPTGGFRAYKKIAGVEYQIYKATMEDAQEVQNKLEAMARLSSQAVFAKCGRLLGCRLRLVQRAGRTPHITMRIVRQQSHNRSQKEIRFGDSFETLWKETLKYWRAFYDIHQTDLKDFSAQIKQAKRLYLQDIGLLEAKLKQAADA